MAAIHVAGVHGETCGSVLWTHSQVPTTCPYRVIRQKYWTLYMKTSVCFVVAGNIKSPLKRALRVMWLQTLRVAEEV